MERLFMEYASYVALILEGIAVVLVGLGGVEAALRAARSPWRRLSGTAGSLHRDKEIFLRFATALVLGLEFELAADVIRTAIAPSWEDLGKLAAVATIRTTLNYFLERDLERYAVGERLGAQGSAAGLESGVAASDQATA